MSSSRPDSGVQQCRAGQAEVVADAVHLADDLVAVFLPVADAVHDFFGGHGDFGGIDAVGAKHRAAAAFGALVEILVPVVDHVARQVDRADQLGKILPGEGKVAPVHLAHQFLARHRHVFGVAGAEEVMAFVGAGAAMHAGVHVHAERAVFVEQVAHLVDGFFLPVFHQFAGKAQCLLNRRSGDERLDVRHHVRLQDRNDRVFLDFWNFEFRDRHDYSLLIKIRRPRRNMPLFARVVGLIAAGLKNRPGACSNLLSGNMAISVATRNRCTSSGTSAGRGCSRTASRPG